MKENTNPQEDLHDSLECITSEKFVGSGSRNFVEEDLEIKMEYMVIKNSNVNNLTKDVNEMIKQGWKPFGGIAVSLSESNAYSYFVVAQAMVRNGS